MSGGGGNRFSICLTSFGRVGLRSIWPLLQEKQKWFVKRRNLKPGDVVLIVDDIAPTSSWLTGRVRKTLSDSECVLERPIDKLCLQLEIAEEMWVVTFHVLYLCLRFMILLLTKCE